MPMTSFSVRLVHKYSGMFVVFYVDVCGIQTYSIMAGSLVSRMWSVRIHGIDMSMGNCGRNKDTR